MQVERQLQTKAYDAILSLRARANSPWRTLYRRLSLSRLRLSRITAYLEVKIWFLFSLWKSNNMNKISWKKGEIAPKEQFLLFSTILQNWYVEVRISRSISESHLDFEITRIDCTWFNQRKAKQLTPSYSLKWPQRQTGPTSHNK